MKPSVACGRLVLDFFQGDDARAAVWFGTPNPLLGNLTPDGYANLKGWRRLLRWINEQLDANTEPPAPFPYIYGDDPECSLLRNDIRCRKCHWCLRAIHGADYWERGVTS